MLVQNLTSVLFHVEPDSIVVTCKNGMRQANRVVVFLQQ